MNLRYHLNSLALLSVVVMLMIDLFQFKTESILKITDKHLITVLKTITKSIDLVTANKSAILNIYALLWGF